MAQGRTIDVHAVIEEAPFGAYQLMIVALSALVIMLDGYDILVVSFVAPVMSKAMGVDVGAFGMVFSVGLVGLIIGALFVSPLGDLWGRKGVMLLSLLVFGAFTLVPIYDYQYSHLLVYRAITGLGLSAAIPTAVAIASEYSPQRFRGLLVNIAFSAFGIGGVIGGFAASRLVPVYGWQAAFWIGGIPALVLIFILMWLLPESAAFMAAANRNSLAIARILRRIDTRREFSAADTYVTTETKEKRGDVRSLFTSGRALGTLIIWLAIFCGLFNSGLLANWLAVVMSCSGMSLDRAILAPVVMQLGGVIGTIFLGMIMRRFGAHLVAVSFFLGACFTVLIGQFTGSAPLAFTAVFLMGIFLVGAYFSMNAIMAAFYPVSIRSTGIGWGLGIGRTGGAVGPLIGGAMITARWDFGLMFLVVAIPAVVATIGVWILAARYANLAHGTDAHQNTVREVTP